MLPYLLSFPPTLRASGGDNIALIPPPEYASGEKYTNLFK